MKFIKNILIFLLITCYSCAILEPDYFAGYRQFDLIKNNNMLFIKAKLNKKNVLFLIDTGASKSMLDINKAKKYGYGCSVIGEDKYIGIGGIQKIYSIYNYEVDIFFIPLLGTDLDEIAPYFRQDGVDIVGIIGSDFFNDRNAYIDYKNCKLYYKK